MNDLRSADGTEARVPRRPARSTCACCRADDAARDDGLPLIVEHRLRLSLDCLANARRMARLAGEPAGIPLVSDLRRFARFIRQVTRAVERHLLAIKAALPVSATNLDAPDWKEGA